MHRTETLIVINLNMKILYSQRTISKACQGGISFILFKGFCIDLNSGNTISLHEVNTLYLLYL